MHLSALSPEDMVEIGRQMALSARRGNIYALCGGLGAGKTHWTKGFMDGLKSTAEVTSPTFGLLHEYPSPLGTVFHLDFYRMNTEQEVLALGWDEMMEEDGITIVEWADRFPSLLPTHSVWLQFEVAADGTRQIRLTSDITDQGNPLSLSNR